MPKKNRATPTSKYKSAGVDVEAGDQLVDWLTQTNSNQAQIHGDKIVSGIGGFAALFRMNFPLIKKPLLVSSTDGVGTKVKLASDFDRLEGVGQDLVAMCVNDLVTTGAMPLFFLDYFATGKLDLAQAQQFLRGLKAACQEAKIALIGGETAEMPGIYHGRDFDCAGFAVGLVDEDKVLGPHRVQAGDCLVGIASSGCHSNGYSLLRKTFAEDMQDWVDELLTPTHLYVNLTFALNPYVNAYANVTGGGVDNLPRVIPKDHSIQLKVWKWPKIFMEVQKRNSMGPQETLKTLNCGVGFVAFCPPKNLSKLNRMISDQGHRAIPLGEVVKEKSSGQILWPKEWQ